MIDQIWTIVCSRAVIDRFSNNISRQNIIDQIIIMDEPKPDSNVPIKFDVITAWGRTNPDIPSKARSRLTLLSPLGESYGESELEVNLIETERFWTRFRSEGMPAREGGRHIFRTELWSEEANEWQQVAETPLNVIFAKPDNEVEVAEEN